LLLRKIQVNSRRGKSKDFKIRLEGPKPRETGTKRNRKNFRVVARRAWFIVSLGNINEEFQSDAETKGRDSDEERRAVRASNNCHANRSSLSYEQNKEQLSSASRRDGYFSYVSTHVSEVQETTLLSVDSQRARSCLPCLLTATPTPTAWIQQCKTPPPSVSTPGAPTTCNGKTSASALNLSATTTATAKKKQQQPQLRLLLRNRLQPQL